MSTAPAADAMQRLGQALLDYYQHRAQVATGGLSEAEEAAARQRMAAASATYLDAHRGGGGGSRLIIVSLKQCCSALESMEREGGPVTVQMALDARQKCVSKNVGH